MGINIARSAVSQPQQRIEHSAPSSRSRTFAPAPSATVHLVHTITLIIVVLFQVQDQIQNSRKTLWGN